jgi:ATP-dependent helicase/nuclease subunit A
MDGCSELTVAPSDTRVPLAAPGLTAAGLEGALASVQERGARVAAPTYQLVAAKARALPDVIKPHGVGAHATEVGIVIHSLLQIVMSRPMADWKGTAPLLVEDQGLGREFADMCIDVVRRVMQSALWQRASESSCRLVEVPFATLVGSPAEVSANLPTILRGVLDLAFREERGWVIVDYKTEQVVGEQLQELAHYYHNQLATYAQHWSQIVGEPIAETGLFFTHSGKYVPLYVA